MYHPSRGGVRGGRDQFKWEDVKVDKHRENYMGHSIMAPVGRWQKGKDLHWYARDKNSRDLQAESMKLEIQKIKEEEEHAMREALGLAPKRANRSQGNRLDKHEFADLVKRGSTAEDLGAGHADAAQVLGLGFSRTPRNWAEQNNHTEILDGVHKESTNQTVPPKTLVRNDKDSSDDETKEKQRREKRRREEEKHGGLEKKYRSRDSDGKRKQSHKRGKEKRRHDSDSD